MKITQEIRECVRMQEDGAGSAEGEAGMAEMSRVGEESGRELYLGAGGREQH